MADAVILRWLKSRGRGVRARRGPDRGRDRQGDRRLRGRVGRDARLDPRPEGATVRRRRADRDARERRRRGGPRQLRAHSPSRWLRRRLRPGRRGGPAEDDCASVPIATPVARRTAVELGVSLHGIAGTGPGGRITRRGRDQSAAAESRHPTASSLPPAAGKGEVSIARADADAGDDRAPDGRVGDDDPGLHRLGRRRRVADRRVCGAEPASEATSAPSVNDFVVKAAAASAARRSRASTRRTSTARSSATHG